MQKIEGLASPRRLKLCKTVFESCYGGTQLCKLKLELTEAIGSVRGRLGPAGGDGCGSGLRLAAEQMHVAGFAGSGLPRQKQDERTVCLGIAAGEPLEGGLDGGEIVEGEEAVGAAAEFAGGLWAAEQKEAKDSGLVAAEIKNGAGAMLELGDAALTDRGGQLVSFKGVESLADLLLVEIEDGVAAGALVAGVQQGVEGEWVALGGGDLFFDQRAEDALLDEV